MKMEMGVDIKSDDDIRVSMMVGIERSAAAAIAENGGGELTPEDLCGQAGGDTGVKDATVKDVSNDDYIACQMSGTSDLKAMADSLEHADGKYTFAMTSGEDDSQLSADMFDSFKVSVTFPGDVQEHNGSSTVDGTTVTWTDPKDLYGSEGLRAVGNDTASSSVWMWMLLAGAVVLVVAAVVVLLLVLRSRRGKRAAPMQPYPAPAGPLPAPQAQPPAPQFSQQPPPQPVPQTQPPAAEPAAQPPAPQPDVPQPGLPQPVPQAQPPAAEPVAQPPAPQPDVPQPDLQAQPQTAEPAAHPPASQPDVPQPDLQAQSSAAEPAAQPPAPQPDVPQPDPQAQPPAAEPGEQPPPPTTDPQ